MGKLLAIETSCDESAAAILDYDSSNASITDALISSQIMIHREFGGVVPEVASRNHSINLPELVKSLLDQNQLRPRDFDAFAATGGPGLASSLLIGHSFAKGLAASCKKPFYSVNHMEGHLLSPFISSGEKSIPPHLALIVSGGHTMLIKVDGLNQYQLISKTIDDAAGEAFDKVGRMLGLPYPGGPEIEKLARDGNSKQFSFPRSLPGKLDFSFSGLKTAVLYTLKDLGYNTHNLPKGKILADLCASFQQAVIDSLVKKTLKAAQATNSRLITLSGGVSCNLALTNALQEALSRRNIHFLPCERKYSTDNAAMISYSAWFYHRQGLHSPLNTNINPNLALA